MSFNRYAEIKTGNMTITSDDLDIRFTVPFDDDVEPNETEITVYNLTRDTINRLKEKQPLTLNAGYEGDVGEVVSGFISKVKTTRDGSDKETVIHVLDSSDKSEITAEKAYKENTKGAQIINDLAPKLNLPTEIHLPEDVTYKEGYDVDGKITDALEEVATDCGARFYINRGTLYIQPFDQGSDTQFTVTPDNGLIGSPSPFEDDEEEGFEIELLLQHRITTASLIKVESKEVQGKFRVRNGEHTWSGDDFLTTCEVV